MEFFEAMAILKRIPGAVMSRPGDGSDDSFVVRTERGDIVSPTKSDPPGISPGRELIAEQDKAIKLLEERVNQLLLEISAERELTANKDKAIKLMGERVNRMILESSEMKAQLLRHQNMLARVSADDWTQIGLREKLHEDAKRESQLEQEKLKRERDEVICQNPSSQVRRVSCKCRGEVENCHFCYGSGYWETDGKGNKL